MSIASFVSRMILGLTWVVLALLKIGDGGSQEAVADFVAAPFVGPVSIALVAAELAVGIGLLLPLRRTRSAALTSSICLLLIYGTYAVVRAPVRCTCAGRLAELGPLEHTLLTAAMLLLSALAWRTRSEASDRRVLRAGILAGLAVGVLAILSPVIVGGQSHPLEEEAIRLSYTHTAAYASGPGLSGAPTAGEAGDVQPTAVERVEEGSGVRGLVQDADGAPVGGATIWLAGPDTYVTRSPQSVTISDSDGAFSLAAPDVETQHLLVRADGFLPHESALVAVPTTGESLRVVLDRGHKIWGLVEDVRGEPVAGALVEAWGRFAEDTALDPNLLFGPKAVPTLARTRTGSDGRFVLSGLPETPVSVYARKRGYFSPTRRSPPVTHPGTELTLKLHGIYEARCLAVDAETGQSIPAASYRIMLMHDSGWTYAVDSSERYTTHFPGKSGFYTQNGIAAQFAPVQPTPKTSAVRMLIEAPGYKKRFVEVPLIASTEAAAPARAEITRKDQEPLSQVSIRARWPNGNPFTGTLVVRIGLQSQTRRSWATRAMAMAFDNGKCEGTVPLPPGEYIARARGHEASSHPLITAPFVTPFRVASDAPTTTEIVVNGGIVLVKPQTTSGADVREFTVSITGPSTAISISTWLGGVPHQRGVGEDRHAVLLYLEPGQSKVRLVKEGFQKVEHSLKVPGDGGVVRWEPVLKPVEK